MTAWPISQFSNFTFWPQIILKLQIDPKRYKTLQIVPFQEFQQYLHDFKILKNFQISPYI